VRVSDTAADARQLIAYVVPDGARAPGGHELRQFLAGCLPDYMVPAAFVALPRFPLTPNGKIDVRALPAPEAPERDTALAPPRDAVEEVLVDIWARVLGVEHVGVDDNFFQLGGHSLLATQVVSRIRKVFRSDLPLSALFEKPTIAELSTAIRANARDPADIERVANAIVRVKNMSTAEIGRLLVEN
jgi:acyl carrier protein